MSDLREKVQQRVQHYSLTIEPDDSCYMELDPDGRYVIAEEADALVPEGAVLVTEEGLAAHYVTAIDCDHDAKTDTVRCSCSVWTGTPKPNVGAAVREWVAHVLEHARLRDTP